jgi:hypothetical protein
MGIYLTCENQDLTIQALSSAMVSSSSLSVLDSSLLLIKNFIASPYSF